MRPTILPTLAIWCTILLASPIWLHAQQDSLYLVTDSIKVHEVSGASAAELYKRAYAFANEKYPTRITKNDTAAKSLVFTVRCAAMGSYNLVVSGIVKTSYPFVDVFELSATITIECKDAKYRVRWRLNEDLVRNNPQAYLRSTNTGGITRDYAIRMRDNVPATTKSAKQTRSAMFEVAKQQVYMLNLQCREHLKQVSGAMTIPSANNVGSDW